MSGPAPTTTTTTPVADDEVTPMPMIVRDSTPACPCSLCTQLGQALSLHRDAIHAVEQSRAQVEQAARKVNARHCLRSALGSDSGDWRARS